MALRPTGTATISFGLVSIPVNLFSASESKAAISFNMLHDADHARVKQQLVCTKDGETVERDHIVKGYEFEKGRCGLAKYAARGKQYLVVVRPVTGHEGGLMMQQLNYADEIRSFNDVEI